MAVKFCAVDPSISCTGLAILEERNEGEFILIEKTSLITTKVKYKDRWDKKVAALELFNYWLTPRIEDISFFVFENYSYGSPGHLADLGELNGMFRLFIHHYDKPVDYMAPSSIKKFVTGSGKATKREVQADLSKYILNFEDIKFNNLDESDAAAVGVAYALKMRGIINESEKNRESLEGD
jgi:Holliday junction resolvasome RuvABC endonuclease subunit